MKEILLKNNKKVLGVNIRTYLATFLVIFLISLFVYGVFVIYIDGGFAFKNNKNDNVLVNAREQLLLPERILISKIDVDQQVFNPSSKLVDDLDKELLKGVVRYPDSGLLGEKKNIFLFAHSTGFKVVKNQAFKAFNRLGELGSGDDVLLISEDTAYLYRVFSSNEVSAETALIEFDNKDTLILSTCNTFGEQSARIIVRAKFIKKYQLAG